MAQRGAIGDNGGDGKKRVKGKNSNRDNYLENIKNKNFFLKNHPIFYITLYLGFLYFLIFSVVWILCTHFNVEIVVSEALLVFPWRMLVKALDD